MLGISLNFKHSQALKNRPFAMRGYMRGAESRNPPNDASLYLLVYSSVQYLGGICINCKHSYISFSYRLKAHRGNVCNEGVFGDLERC